jgi:3-dehydroquinate synthetase
MWLLKNGKEIINRSNIKSLELAIKHSCKIKAKIISADEKENSLRMVLNFGHTFAHGFEAANKFAKKINHGEAVLIGMMMASILSYKKKILSYKELNLIEQHYVDLNLPMSIKKMFKKKDIEKIVNFMKKDKKNFNKKISLILIEKIGKATKPNSFYFDEKFIKRFLISLCI